jgi:hypothetical protein
MPDTYELLVSVGKAVRSLGGWSTIESYPIGKTFLAGDYTAKVVAKVTDPGYPANGYDGAYEQGSEFETYIVLEAEGQFFKKTGTGDSYGEVSWDGDLLPATVKEKVVKVYE